MSNLLFFVYQKVEELRGFPTITSRFKRNLGYKPDFKEPTTFNEKVIANILYNRDKRFETYADKVAARDVVANQVGSTFLIPLLDVLEDPKLLCLTKYETPFIVKPNFTSGHNTIVRTPSTEEDRIRKGYMKLWKRAYGKSKMLWYTQNMTRKLVIEKLLLEDDGAIPKDFKFFCFAGKVGFIQVDIDRFGLHKRALYDADFRFIPVHFSNDLHKGLGFDGVMKPKNFDQMIRIAEKLSANFPFLRVDLYNVNGEIFFGEFTMYPGSGTTPFHPTEYDAKFGALWNFRFESRNLPLNSFWNLK